MSLYVQDFCAGVNYLESLLRERLFCREGAGQMTVLSQDLLDLALLGEGASVPAACQRLLSPCFVLLLNCNCLRSGLWKSVINSGGQEAYYTVMSDWRDWQQLKLLYETSQGRALLSIERTVQTLKQFMFLPRFEPGEGKDNL